MTRQRGHHMHAVSQAEDPPRMHGPTAALACRRKSDSPRLCQAWVTWNLFQVVQARVETPSALSISHRVCQSYSADETCSEGSSWIRNPGVGAAAAVFGSQHPDGHGHAESERQEGTIP